MRSNSTLVAELVKSTGYDAARLGTISSDPQAGFAVTYLAHQATGLLYAIEHAESAARRALDALAEYTVQAIKNLDRGADDEGTWVAQYATKAAEAMAKAQAQAREFVTLTNVLNRALAGE